MKKVANVILPIFAIIMVIIMLLVMGNRAKKETVIEPSFSLKSPGLSYVPQGFPRMIGEGENVKEFYPEFDPRFLKMRPVEVFKVPRVIEFSAPMGAANGAFTYNAQRYWEFNQRFGGHHSGDDVNGIGGMNSDLGDPVFSIADGYVTYTGVPGLNWGNVVLIAHRVKKDGEEKIIQSMYAHLDEISVKVGDKVLRSQRIGRVGNVGGIYPAHLHFEIREGTNLYIGPGYLSKPRTHLSPEEFLEPYLEDEAVFINIKHAVEFTDNLWQRLEIVNPQYMLNLDQ